jgi:hypothetical protein
VSTFSYISFYQGTAVTMKSGVFWDVGSVALVRTEVSEELSASFIKVTRSGKLGISSQRVSVVS